MVDPPFDNICSEGYLKIISVGFQSSSIIKFSLRFCYFICVPQLAGKVILPFPAAKFTSILSVAANPQSSYTKTLLANLFLMTFLPSIKFTGDGLVLFKHSFFP